MPDGQCSSSRTLTCIFKDIDLTEAPGKILIPLFRRGPKDSGLVWWFLQARPNIYKNIKGYSLYIGFMGCKNSEYDEITQYYNCYKFGHIAAKCNANKITCGFCAEEGHTV